MACQELKIMIDDSVFEQYGIKKLSTRSKNQ